MPMGQEADGVCYPIYWEGDDNTDPNTVTKSAKKVPASDFDAIPEHTDGKGLKGKLAKYEGRDVRIVKSFSKGQKLSIEWDELASPASSSFASSAASSEESSASTNAANSGGRPETVTETNRLWERCATTVWGAKRVSPSV